MAIFALSDLHLPLGVEKPMDIFGGRWDNYVEKIEYEWKKAICEDDYVIINGDFSWATYLDDAINDFKFLSLLPGVKLISKGNHDYWWSTLKKMSEFLENNNIANIHFLQNNAILCGDTAVCAARGWITPRDKSFKADDEKIYNRELMRFETSLKEAGKLSDRIIAALHYPPDDKFKSLCDEYGVYKTVYGHLHGKRAEDYVCNYDNFYLVSADFLRFKPMRLI